MSFEKVREAVSFKLTRAQLECFISDKALNARALNGFKNDTSDEFFG
jgi:hypothetical protein